MSTRQDSMRGYKTPPDVMAIGVRYAVLEFPEAERPDALRDLVGLLKDFYRSRNHPVPEFVGMLENEVEGSGA
jgi:hypothetical protein